MNRRPAKPKSEPSLPLDEVELQIVVQLEKAFIEYLHDNGESLYDYLGRKAHRRSVTVLKREFREYLKWTGFDTVLPK